MELDSFECLTKEVTICRPFNILEKSRKKIGFDQIESEYHQILKKKKTNRFQIF